MPTVETAAVTAVTFAALFAGHHLGDHPFQPPGAVAGKSAPERDELARGAHPWRGWSWCVRHVLVYTAVQACCLALIAVIAPLTITGAVAALTVSGATHAVIDRRWVVRWFLDAKGAHDWAEGPYLVDQSLHVAMLLLAAVAGAGITGMPALAGVLSGCAGLIVVGLLVERRRAHVAAPLAVSSGHR